MSDRILGMKIHAPHLTRHTPEGRAAIAARPAPDPARQVITITLPAASWAELHRHASDYTGEDDWPWLRMFAVRIPGACSCRNHWAEIVRRAPPDFGNYFAWSVARHNDVNRMLGKPELYLAEALQIWGLVRPI